MLSRNDKKETEEICKLSSNGYFYTPSQNIGVCQQLDHIQAVVPLHFQRSSCTMAWEESDLSNRGKKHHTQRENPPAAILSVVYKKSSDYILMIMKKNDIQSPEKRKESFPSSYFVRLPENCPSSSGSFFAGVKSFTTSYGLRYRAHLSFRDMLFQSMKKNKKKNKFSLFPPFVHVIIDCKLKTWWMNRRMWDRNEMCRRVRGV